MSTPQLLLLEDDQSFGYILSEYLGMQQFEVRWASNAEEATKLLEQYRFDLAILDIMLPSIDGFAFAQQLVTRHADLPFIFLSAKSLKIDKLKGYKLGACDYINKPVDEEVLVAKIKALLRTRTTHNEQLTVYTLGQYRFFPEQHKLIFDEIETKLTHRESVLLQLFCQHQGRLLPRQKALSDIWGSTDEFSRKSMDVFVSRLRKYLAQDPGIRIENVHGQGFILYAP